ncbi:SSU ribosomal protein S8P [Trichlorobacter thiogenes]|jgi:small subunit ribosomal protein S8|uniref:Small ribosomal subunit protein uS8 n=1 Tax=Trichlorobacter thiogenes TaxID=115783 RepID=A0A1T4P707_9BACT|nr:MULTISPECIES: 30S ribosomal protein S8 [Trichlorobacter]MDD2499359.1 30S ribosomal protein S8 [Geobacter sp.]MDK9717788.1 30S ribosomal protein S8 [Trichlorobacter sp.]SJZ87117.1 SSU ribosomal protein S8P [Trichlorobacter thiogenes]
MSMTDPIADMLTRIRNANMVKLQKVDIPSSNVKVNIAQVLKQEGYIKNYKVIADNRQGVLRVYLKFIDEKDPVINEITRISKPGSRTYVDSESIPTIKNGLGIAILSTSKGIMTDVSARQAGIGGELLCTVW